METKNNPVEDTKQTTTEVPAEEVKADEQDQNKEEQKIGEVLPAVEEPVETPKKEIDESLIVELKRELKEAREETKKLRSEGRPAISTSQSIKAVAEEYGVDETFVAKLASAIKSEAVSEVETKYSEKISSLEKQKAEETRRKAIENLYDRSIERLPFFAEVADKDVILDLASRPENKNKTMSELLDKVYGRVVGGKKSMETSQGASPKEAEKIDFSQVTAEDLKSIRADKNLSEAYSKYLRDNLRL